MALAYTLPKRLNNSITKMMTILFTPILRINLQRSSRLVNFRNNDYLRFILLATPFMMSSLTLNNQLRLQGNARFGMIGIASGAILNIILDPIFIFVLDMGVSGASLATAVSQCFGNIFHVQEDT